MDKVAFHIYNKAGENARIVGEIENKLGDRKKHADYEWRQEWQDFFYTGREFDRQVFIDEFFKVMRAFQDSLGLAVVD